MDGDNRDELVATGMGLSTRVYDDKNANFAMIKNFSDGNPGDVACGDFDGDGRDEIVTIAAPGYGISTGLRIYDDATANFTLLNAITFPHIYTEINGCCYFPRVNTGDVDGDGKDEIAYIYHYYGPGGVNETQLVVIDEMSNALFQDGVVECAPEQNYQYDPFWVNMYPTSDVCMGDFDNDGLDEIAVGGWGGIVIHDDAKHSFVQLKAFWGPSTNIKLLHFRLAAGAFDNSSTNDELAVLALHVDSDNGLEIVHVLVFTFSDSALSNAISIMDALLFGSVEPWAHQHWFSGMSITAGNFDDDLLEEIAVVLVEHTAMRLYVYNDHVESNFAVLHSVVFTFPHMGLYVLGHWPTVIAGDFDGDSISVTYTGIRESRMSDPHILCVIVAPPLVNNIQQNYAFSGTTYGTGVSESQSESNGYTDKIGAGVSLQAGCFWFEAEISTTISAEWSKESSEKSVFSECTSYTTDSTENYVVFETVAYDTYYYNITSHPIVDRINTIFALTMPRDPQTYKWTVPYFNEHNGGTVDIGPETFNHTIGEVWTYPDIDARDILMARYLSRGAWRSSSATPVGLGSGYNTVSIDLSQETSSVETRSWAVDFSATFTLAQTFGLSASYGFGGQHAYEVSFGENTAFSAVVGDIAEADYQTYNYSFGLFVYNINRNDSSHFRNVSYTVINYWVQDYYGPHYLPSDLGPEVILYASLILAGIVGSVVVVWKYAVKSRKVPVKPKTPKTPKTPTTPKTPKAQKIQKIQKTQETSSPE